MKKVTYKLTVIISIQLLIALIHAFRLGQLFHGDWYRLYYSYFSDVVVPFGFYFLLCAYERGVSFLRPWYAKALLIFSAAAAAEILQYFGFYALGTTYDPLDFLAYAAGVLCAAIVDTRVLSRIGTFWTTRYE